MAYCNMRTVTAEPPASAATPEPASTTATTTTTRAVAERRLTAASKLLVTANAALQQKSANAEFAGQQSRSQAEAMCQLFNWASDSFEDALAGKTWNHPARCFAQEGWGYCVHVRGTV